MNLTIRQLQELHDAFAHLRPIKLGRESGWALAKIRRKVTEHLAIAQAEQERIRDLYYEQDGTEYRPKSEQDEQDYRATMEGILEISVHLDVEPLCVDLLKKVAQIKPVMLFGLTYILDDDLSQPVKSGTVQLDASELQALRTGMVDFGKIPFAYRDTLSVWRVWCSLSAALDKLEAGRKELRIVHAKRDAAGSYIAVPGRYDEIEVKDTFQAAWNVYRKETWPIQTLESSVITALPDEMAYSALDGIDLVLPVPVEADNDRENQS